MDSPTLPIPFEKLLKIVVVADAENPQVHELLDRIAGEGFELELNDRYRRDVFDDAAVGAYVVAVDGERRGPARELAHAIRATGNRTPMWALADSHRIADVGSFELLGEVQGYIYLGQQTPAYYAKQVVASLVEYGMSLLPPFFGGLLAYDYAANRIVFHTYAVRE
jgi:hypothetical protein